MPQGKRLADQTAEKLLHIIRTDPAYAPGERLPGEQQLCAFFGVSRTTLREAIRSLAAQGFLEVRRGSGTFVLAQPGDVDLQGLERVHVRLRDLFEIRMMVEPVAARLACIRGSHQEIQEIIHWAKEEEKILRAGEDYSEAEEKFHLAVMAATHNPLMEQLVPIIHNALRESWDTLDVSGLLTVDTIEYNTLLVKFFQKRDGYGAEYAMAAHIRNTINTLGLEKEPGRV